MLWCFHDVFRVVAMHSKCTTIEHRKLFHCMCSGIQVALPASGSSVPNSSRLKLYTAIAVYVIIEKRCRNNAHDKTQNDCSMLIFLSQIVFYTPTFSIQFLRNTMPSWLHLCFIHWVYVVDVHCRIVETITMKYRTV